MKNKKRLITVIAAVLVSALLFSGCGKGNSASVEENGFKPDTNGFKDISYTANDDGSINSDGYTVAAENEKFILSLNKANGSIIITDRKNGYIWSSGYDLKAAGVDKKLNETWRNNINSIIYISYYDNNNNSGIDTQTNALQEKAKIKVDALNNDEKGFKITYLFDKLSIQLEVDIVITDNGFDITVPFEKIKEGTDYKLTKIALMPVFGAASSKSNGYMFYPDGSGALAYFDENDVLQPAETVTLTTYGTESLDVSRLLKERNLERQQDLLPVFGLKNGENAFLGVITDGDADSEINISTGNLILDMNNIYASFNYRRQIDITAVNNSISTASDAKSYKFDTKIIEQDIKISYYLLNGGNANYSGMANAYRNYLIDNKALNSVELSKNPLALSIFMGAVEDRAMFSKFQSVTTYKEAENIISTLKNDSGITDMLVTLNGWNSGGYRASVMPSEINKKLGTKSDFSDISKNLSSENIQLFLQQDYTYFDSDVMSFSKGKDVAYQGTGLVAQEKNIYLPNVKSLCERYLSKFISFSSKYGYGISVNGIGKQLYTDYNKNYGMTRSESAEYLKALSEQDIRITANGNAYMLNFIDSITDVPYTDSGYSITDEDIPFYQMIVHGSLPYSGNVPGNLSADIKRLKLKWIEYGYCPNFEVTYSSSDSLKYTDYNELFSSKFSNWQKAIADITKEFNTLGVSDKKIISHEKIADQVFCTTYDNGTKITVNYNSYAVDVNGLKIEPEAYIQTKEEK